MTLTPRQFLYAMLDKMTDDDIYELCQIIGNLKLDEELTIETLKEASSRKPGWIDDFYTDKNQEDE